MSTTAVDDGRNRILRCMQKGSFGVLLFGLLNPDFGGLETAERTVILFAKREEEIPLA